MLVMAPRSPAPRLKSLDGLRGLAALVVLFHHAALLNQSVFLAHADGHAPADSLGALTTRTPLQILFSGEEAVLIFFVLSGLVLSAPALRGIQFSWLAYYPRRLVRLLVPVVASVLLAGGLALIALRRNEGSTSGWVSSSTMEHFDLGKFLKNLDLFTGETSYNNPLWSLHLELIFSILLPLYVAFALLTSRWRNRITFGATLAVTAVGIVTDDPYLRYLPIFFLGTLLAFHLDAVQGLLQRWPEKRSRWVGAAIFAVALGLFESRWIFQSLLPLPGTGKVSEVLVAIGATAIVALAVAWFPLDRMLRTRLAQWLGRISFSLYLVHVPILLTASALLHEAPWWVAAVVGIPVAIVVAVLFARFVERPAHRLAKRIGGAVEALGGTASAPMLSPSSGK